MNIKLKFKYIFICVLSLFLTDYSYSANNNLSKSKTKREYRNSPKFVLSKNYYQSTNFLENISKELYLNLSRIILANNNSSNFDNIALEIQSDIQYQENDIFVAEGNAIIYFSEGQLSADKIVYDTLKRNFTAFGNIRFQKGSQYFEAEKLYYEFDKKKGFINEVYGVLNIELLNQDLNLKNLSNNKAKLELSDIESEIEDLSYMNSISIGLTNDYGEEKKINITDAKLNIPKIKKWRFTAAKIEIDSNEFKSDKIFFTNDPYNHPQLFLESNNFRGETVDNKLKLTSPNTWIILDNKFKIPIGRRTIVDRDPLSRWWIGSDYLDKDGFYFGRSFDRVKLSDNFDFRLTPYFLIQRTIKGNTNAFTLKGSPTLSEKIVNDISFSDYFALDSEIDGDIYSWDVNLATSLNTFNPERFHEAFRNKLTISKSFNLVPEELQEDEESILTKNGNANFRNYLDIKFSSSFRQQFDKGIDGTAELYFANNIALANRRLWSKNDNNINLSFLYDFGEIRAEKKNFKELKTLSRNVFGSKLSHEFPIWEKQLVENSINQEYNFTPEVIKEGIYWKSSINSGLFLYSDSSSQKAISLNTGPEITYGSFKSNIFDYTKLKINGSYYLKSGQSPFKFDDINDTPRLKMQLIQQIYGPLVFDYETYFDLNDSQFTSPKYRLDIRRRAYSLGAFYYPDSEEFGFRFNIFNFDYSGLSSRFDK